MPKSKTSSNSRTSKGSSSKSMSNTKKIKPSLHFCYTGNLLENEKYNQKIHNAGKTPNERCSKHYPRIFKGGLKTKTKKRKNIRKSKKNYRK